MNHPLSMELNNDSRLIGLLKKEARYIARYNKNVRTVDLRIAKDIRAQIESFNWLSKEAV